MKRNIYFPGGAILLGLLLTTSCRTLDAPSLPRLAADGPAGTARLTGTLVPAANCAATDGGGTTVIIWAIAVDSGGIGTVVVVWPRSAVARRSPGNGSTIVIWPRTAGQGTPVRSGERIELVGGMKDDILGLALERPLPRGCAGRAFVASAFRPAPR
jgi:hypothetical protein